MKTNLTRIEDGKRYGAETRTAHASRMLLQTDCNYSAATIVPFHGRCASGGKRARSFRLISEDYFKHEAPHDFVAEAALFGLIIITAALPLLDGASALAHFARAIGAF